ncbi:hypothetical protein AB0L99_17955 [Streptomyces sp. NPDC051954]|uniref:hypothetical protein n=1 Tax=unclassified Streptomyces TaxID=2593676 RepID=UPI0034393A7A
MPAHADARDIGRNTLAPNDGWAAAERNGSALHTKIDSTERADREVARGAGAGRIP